jgi:hypothetical protein
MPANQEDAVKGTITCMSAAAELSMKAAVTSLYDFAGTVDCRHCVTLQAKVHKCTGTSRQPRGSLGVRHACDGGHYIDGQGSSALRTASAVRTTHEDSWSLKP